MEYTSNAVLTRAAELIDKAPDLLRGGYWTEIDGQRHYDLVGAIMQAHKDIATIVGERPRVTGPLVDIAIRRVATKLGITPNPHSSAEALLYAWNDVRGRTKTDAINALRAAIEVAK